MTRGGTQVRHDMARRGGAGRALAPRPPARRTRRGAGRTWRWLAPAALGTVLGVLGATAGQAVPGVLGPHGTSAAAAGPATSRPAPARTTHRTPPTLRTTTTDGAPATDAAPSGDAPGTTSSTTGSTPSGTTTTPSTSATAPGNRLYAVPAAQDRCPDPARGIVDHAPATARRTVALTFDDGPDAGTPAVLDALAEAGVHATFFVIGDRAEARPDLVRRVAAQGHLVGDHTYDHVYPRDVRGGWTSHYLADQIGRTASAATDATGRPVCWFRPPGGFRTSSLPAAARRMRMSVALWSVDTLDWQVQGARGVHAADMTTRQKADLIVARATDVAGQRHPVVLMHDGGGDRRATALAVPRIVAWYRAHGYAFVRLDGRS